MPFQLPNRAMPLYYFDVYDGLSGPDRVGQVCADREAAFREARRIADGLLADRADWFRTGQDWQIGIVDALAGSTSVWCFTSAADAAKIGNDRRWDPLRRETEPVSGSTAATDQQPGSDLHWHRPRRQDHRSPAG